MILNDPYVAQKVMGGFPNRQSNLFISLCNSLQFGKSLSNQLSGTTECPFLERPTEVTLTADFIAECLSKNIYCLSLANCSSSKSTAFYFPWSSGGNPNY